MEVKKGVELCIVNHSLVLFYADARRRRSRGHNLVEYNLTKEPTSNVLTNLFVAKTIGELYHRPIDAEIFYMHRVINFAILYRNINLFVHE